MADSQLNRDHQFTLANLFSWTSIVAVCLLPFTIPPPLGIIIFVLAIPVLLIAIGKGKIAERILVVLSITAFVCVALALFVGVIGFFVFYEEPPSVESNNARQIGLALLNYEFENGHYPPPFTVDENGKRLHSWRVLILPYMEENSLYKKIDLTKAWDHPENVAAGKRMPEAYRNYQPHGSTSTSFIAVVGDNTMWPTTGKGRKIADVSESTSQTILAINSPQFSLHWMDPNDPTYEQFIATLQDGDIKGLIINGSNYVQGDGAVSHSSKMSREAFIKKILVNDESNE